MKILATSDKWQATGKVREENLVTRHSSSVAGFTMVEIAISLAIIGIALVAIIGVLPLGMNVQKDNREETIINQDATVFMEAIRSGGRSYAGADLTNYVYAITNFQVKFPAGTLNTYGYDNAYLTNNARIIGILNTPEYTGNDGTPLINLSGGGSSNHIVAYVRSISGSAVEKPPQDNDLVRDSSFSYKIVCDNLPVAVDTNSFNPDNSFERSYAENLTANLHELRLTFLWPLLPSGNVGYGHQTFRTLVAGEMVTNIDNNTVLFFFQPQTFVQAP